MKKSRRSESSGMTAAEWVTLFRESKPSAADRKRFVDWLQESPAHVAEYLELASIWHDIGLVADSVDIEQLPEIQSNVVSLRKPAQKTGGRVEEPALAGWINASRARAMAAGVSAVIVGTALLWTVSSFSPAVYETATGEQRSIPLTDGSLVSLNTRSGIRISFGETERRVELLAGEALFDVASDPDRPFVVIAAQTEIHAIGTAFNVYHRADKSLAVTVLEGRVALMAMSAPESASPAAPGGRSIGSGQAVQLAAGQQANISATSPRIEEQLVDTDSVVAWTNRRIVFQNSSLADVVMEFNRYNTATMEVVDPALSELRLSGVFDARDPDSLIEFLRRSQRIRVIRISEDHRLLAPEA